jgi:hypothetical protein
LHHPTKCRCLGCHGQAREYHHHDYCEPLDVTPLCWDCHRQLHAYMKREGIDVTRPQLKSAS